MFRIFKKLIDPRKEIISEIKQLNFEDFDTVTKLIKPTAILDFKNENPKIGSSKFGGCPDLANSTDWPKYEGKPMVFFCQISIKELSFVDCGLKFENDGLISFFHFFNEPESEFGAMYDYRPENEVYKVLFQQQNAPLMRTDYPSDYYEDYKFEEKSISFIQSYQIPGTPENALVLNSNLSESDKNKLYDYAERFMNLFESQIGGYPLPAQAGPELDWTSSKWPNLEYLSSDFKLKAMQFENLLSFSFQFDFEAIGDSNLYIGILKDDLEELNFDGSTVIHQST